MSSVYSRRTIPLLLRTEEQYQYHFRAGIIRCRHYSERSFSSALVEEHDSCHSLQEPEGRPERRTSRTTTTTGPPIYVGATREHVGKTTVCLALISGLQKRFANVGFMKPVGQQSCREEEIGDDGQTTMEVLCDKDVSLVKQYFRMDHLNYRHMNPITIPPGYTRDYMDGQIPQKIQRTLVEDAYNRVSAASDIVVCEGTGHCAVGSIVQASNAQIASWVNGKMVLVANGGLGNTFDELELNRLVCESHNLKIAGVIVNRVLPEKYEQTRYYIEKALRINWNNDVPLLGCIPDRRFLGCPAVYDLQQLFEGSMLMCGQPHRYRHYAIDELNLVATSLQVFLTKLRSNPSRTLYICHASRNDILLGFLIESQRMGLQSESTLLVCGAEEYPLSSQVLDIISGMEDDQSQPPILVVPHGVRQAMAMIHSYIPKLHYEDSHRVDIALQHYEPYIDFDLLLERTGHKDTKTAAN